MSENKSTKPMAKVHQVSAFPLRGAHLDKAYNPEGSESSHGECPAPASASERMKLAELVRGAMNGGPTGRY